MRLNPGTRTQFLAHMTLDFDPTGSTVEVKVDDSWYAASWLSMPVVTGSQWKQTARTTGYFAGPTATANGAVVLAAGRHLTCTRVTTGGTVLTRPSDPIDV